MKLGYRAGSVRLAHLSLTFSVRGWDCQSRCGSGELRARQLRGGHLTHAEGFRSRCGERESDRSKRVWIDPESARRTIGSGGVPFHSGRYRPAEFGLAPMFILVVLASVAYLAIGFGFAMLSLHELATGRRDRALNRLMAWSGVVLWLPTLLVVVVSALFVSFWRARSPDSATAARPDAAVAEQRTIRRAIRQV